MLKFIQCELYWSVIGWIMCWTRSGRLGRRWIWVKLRRGSRWWTNEGRLRVTWLGTLWRLVIQLYHWHFSQYYLGQLSLLSLRGRLINCQLVWPGLAKCVHGSHLAVHSAICLLAGKPSQYVSHYLGQLSLLSPWGQINEVLASFVLLACHISYQGGLLL